MIVKLVRDDQEIDVELGEMLHLASGAFGRVFMCTMTLKDENRSLKVAIKQVSVSFEKNELGVMKKLGSNHVNIVKFLCYYHTTVVVSDTSLCRNINFIQELMPMNLGLHITQLSMQQESIDLTRLKLFAYQLFRALGFVHSTKICHRDLKPTNILIDLKTNVLKLCDFGCAREMTDTAPSCSYVCSRYYRAPELVFGATNYTTKIDIWSAGCVVAEMASLTVLFRGDSNIDMIDKIVRVLGTPTKQEMQSMKSNFKNNVFIPDVMKKNWPRKLLSNSTPKLMDLIGTALQYNPRFRTSGYETCAHAFFDELRESDPETRRHFPPLFDFTDQELLAIDLSLEVKLKPRDHNGQNTLFFGTTHEIE